MFLSYLITCRRRMASFMFTNTRTCSKYLQPLLGHHLLHYYGQFVPVVLQGCKNPHVQLFCTHMEVSPKQSKGRSKPTDFCSEECRPIRSVFAAGTARRRMELGRRQGQPEKEPDTYIGRYSPSLLEKIPKKPLSPEEWRRLRDDSPFPNRFAGQMLNMMPTAGTDVDVAKSLLAFVALDSGTVPFVLIRKYLAFCVSGGHHSEVLDTYDLIRSCFKTVDIGVCSLMLKGFRQTERWREMLPMLEKIKKAVTPTSRNYGNIITGMFLHGDSETGWKLYEEMLDKGLKPNQDVWKCMFDCANGQQKDRDKVLDILTYMRENQVYPQEMLAKSIKTWFESLPGEGWTGRFSSVDSRERCGSCQAELESIELTEEEYAELKHRVMKNIIEGRDVFTKTTPEELQCFKNFVKNCPPFDIIVDGLNVASIFVHGPKSQNLLTVVSELFNQGLKVLVLGRKHMLKHSSLWKKEDIHKIKQMAHCFFTENISKDDPFLLYAALNSGNKCKFVSLDLMRDHKACLPDSFTRRLFFKWQRGHQLVVSFHSLGKKVQFQSALRYDTIVQSTGTTWHIPYDEDGEDRSSCEVPQRWLCLTKQH